VLLRQIKRARRDYIQTQLNRCKLTNKTRRADTFCMGWVHAATCLLQALARTEEQDAAVKAYKDKNHPALRDLYGRDRNADRRMSDRDYDDLAAGRLSGRNAQLHRGVGEADKPLALSQ
jgi:hypothetical protein